jgi:dipeptidyl-peptidase-4
MPLTLEQVARYPRPGMAIPARFAFTPDGRAVTFLASAEGGLVRSLWRHDIASGERQVLAGPDAGATSEEDLSRDEELRRERKRLRELGVTDYHFAREAEPPVLAVPSSAGVSVAVGDGELQAVAGTDAVIDALLSPDGRRLAFVRDGDLYVLDMPADGRAIAGDPRRLTADAEDGLTNGLAEFMAQEELDRDRGFWWSPDGERLAFIRADSRHIPRYPIVHQGLDAPDVEEHRYPFAGERNAVLRLGVVGAGGGAVTWMDLGDDDDQYIARVAWRPDGVLATELLARDQKSVRWLTFGVDGTAAVLLEERSEPWLNLDHDTRFLESGEIVRSSEASGYRHLELRAADGTLVRRLTHGEWVVTGLLRVDEPGRVAWFVGTRDGPLERHVYTVSLDGGEPQRRTTEPGWHAAVVSEDGEHWVDSWSDVALAPTVTLRRADGSLVATLHDGRAVTAASLGLTVPEFVQLPAADGTVLHGALYRPRDGSADPVPLIVSVYGGPQAQMVTNQWAMTVDLRAQYLAQSGFLVLKLDNRGSIDRGLAFEGHIDRRMGTVEIEDQATGARWAIERGLADPERVGIYGWSYGGYATLLAMLREPDLFRVGVAGAPVTALDGYDTAYTERYMGTPADEPDAYREGSVLTHADALRGELLLVHGLVDENVHFRHTARLMVALGRAQRRYDVLLFPEERHMPRNARDLEYLERRVVDHFRRHLLGDGSDDMPAGD